MTVSIRRQVAAIWAEALNQPSDVVVAIDSFFELGGDSFSMMMILFQVNERLSLQVPPSSILHAPSFDAFCKLVEASLDENSAFAEIDNVD